MNNITAYGSWCKIPLDDIKEDFIVYSFGAGEDICYEFGLSGLKNCEIHIFDPTPRSITHFDYCRNIIANNVEMVNSKRYGGGDINYLRYIKTSNANLNKLFYHNYGLYNADCEIEFYYPKNVEHVSLSIDNLQKTGNTISLEVKKIDTLMKLLNHDKIDIIKLNIEGAEVVSLIHMLENTKIRPKYIAVGFELIRDKRNDDTIKLQNRLNYLILLDYIILNKNNNIYTFLLK